MIIMLCVTFRKVKFLLGIVTNHRVIDKNASSSFVAGDGFITAQQFYLGLQNFKKDVLIMDVRSAQQFGDSKMHGEGYNLINIDDFEIEKGMSANKFEEKLNEDVKKIFSRRDQFAYIVLMDTDSTKDSFPTAKLKILYDMLTMVRRFTLELLKLSCLRKFRFVLI